VRIDAAVGSTSVVSSYYDPMIAKITTWGIDRASAIERMRAALDQTVLLGIQTNVPLHRRVLAEPDFRCGAAVTTRYLDEHPEVTPKNAPADDREVDRVAEDRTAGRARAVAAAAGVRAARAAQAGRGRAAATEDPRGVWRRSARWRS
jgi:acetyl/propionyl-CoA carboxylase alpha subunit